MFYDMGLDVKYKFQEGEEKLVVEDSHEKSIKSALIKPANNETGVAFTNLGVVG